MRGLDPNPARGRRVRLPRVEREPFKIPLRTHVEKIIANAKPELRLPLRVLAETGVRAGELLAWTWGDVDIHGSQILIPKGKTRSARRWFAIPPDLIDQPRPQPRAGPSYRTSRTPWASGAFRVSPRR